MKVYSWTDKYYLASAWSASSSTLFITSRVLYGLSAMGQAPKIFTKVGSFPILANWNIHV